MTIQYAILGLLSWQPFSGYDLKKIISDSDVFYWSGNNNQIYKSLIELHKGSLVEQQIQPQENLPAKKIYSITDPGRIALYNWVRSTPELPELHSNFLIQLAWAGQFTVEEIDTLLASYAAEIDVQLRMQQEKARRPATAPNRTRQETFLWEKIAEKTALDYQHELDWVRRVRAELKEKAAAG